MKDRKTILWVILLTIISVALIFYKFNQIPRTLTFDEVEFAYLALILSHSPFTIFTTFADGHATIYFYIILAFFRLFGITSFALRLPSAIFGVLNIVLFYLIARFPFNKKTKLLTPFILSLVLLTSHWYFNFVRFSFETSFLLFLELVSTYFFFQFYKSRAELDIFTSAIFAGLAFNSYQPGRIFFILPLLFLLINKMPLRRILVYIATVVIIITPLVNYWFMHPGQDVRINDQLYFKNEKLTVQEKISYLGENISKTALMFGVKGDLNGRHNYPGKPALNMFLFIFFAGGIIIAFKNFRNFYNQFFILFFLLALFPTLLTYPVENPSMLRTFTALPSAIYFIGLSLTLFLGLSNKYYKIVTIIIVGVLFISTMYELRTYFKYQVVVFEQAFERRSDLKVMLKRYDIVGKDFYRNHPLRPRE